MISNLVFYKHLSFGIFLTIIAYVISLYFCKTAKIIDIPNERSSHKKPIPRGGGIAIVTTFFIGISAIYLFGYETHIKKPYMVTLIISSALISSISLLDDIRFKSVSVRLLAQGIATIAVMYGGVILNQISLPFYGEVQLGWVGFPITFIWIIGLTNAYNFMDGLDGLIGGTTVIVALFLMGITFYQGSTFVYIVCYTILAGSLGFLFNNFPPAKIFMGDVGSVFLGFVLAVLAIIAARYDNSHTSFLVMPLLLFHIIYDTFFTLVRRWRSGENITLAHRSHLYQLLNRLGHTHLEVTLMQYCMCFMQGLGAIWMLQLVGSERAFVFIPFLVFQIIYSIAVIKKARKAGIV